MKKVIRLSETELTKLVKRIVNEEMENDLRSDIERLLYNSNASNDEIISILRQIADEREESRRVRRDVQSRFNGYN